MSIRKAVVLALVALPLAGCVATEPGYHSDGVYRDGGYRDYDSRDYDYGRNHDRDRDRERDQRDRVRSGTAPAVVDTMQEAHQRRIQQGYQSGEITDAELRRLQAEQRSIRDQETAYRADGRLTDAEKEQLRRRQETAGRNISREGNDAEDVRPRKRD